MIQSAKGVSSAMGLLVQCAHSTDGLIAALDAGADLIRSRDREIIERCKEAMTREYNGRGTLGNFHKMRNALDSVLREIS
jgi:hypothetical protein